MSESPNVEIVGGPTQPQAVIVIAHGGRSVSRAPAHRFRLTYLWQLWFSRRLLPVARRHGAQVWRLRYRYRGWNGSAADAASDLRWAAERAEALPVLLIGHSMGGRAALYAAASPNVMAVCALAPWIEPTDQLDHLIGKPVLILHGDGDRMTDPRRSHQLARRTGAEFVLVEGEGHFMLKRAGYWAHATAQFVDAQLARLTPPA